MCIEWLWVLKALKTFEPIQPIDKSIKKYKHVKKKNLIQQSKSHKTIFIKL